MMKDWQAYMLVVLLPVALGLFFFMLKIDRQQKQLIRDQTGRYVEKSRLNSVCWVRALEALRIIQKDDSVKDACMLLGYQGGGGHAWIEYRRDDEIIQYDPSTDKVISIKRKCPDDK